MKNVQKSKMQENANDWKMTG